MNKNELMNLRRKLISLSGAGIVALTSLAGCSNPIPEQTVTQAIQDESIDLGHDNSKLMITVKGEDDKKRIYLVDKKTFSDLKIYSDSKNYDRYLVSDKASASNTYVYIDVFTLEVVAVKYINENIHIFGKNEMEVTFLSNEIVKEEAAFDYVKEYIGIKVRYSMGELNEMVNRLRLDLIKKQYSR